MYQELVASYGLATRIAGWRVIESSAPYSRAAHPELDREIIAAASDLIDRDGAETVILTGAVMAGVPARLQRDIAVPVIDCLVCGVRQAELLAGLRLPKPRTGSYASPGSRELINIEPAIAQRLKGPGQ